MNLALIFAWCLPIQFFFSQTHYFGGNKKPQSDAELIADGITLLLIAVAILISVVITANREKNK